MLVVRPRLHALIDPADSRTLAQLQALDVDPEQAAATAGRTVAITLGAAATPSQQLLARALLDSVLRLDPLVAEVRLDGFDERVLAGLEQRLPLETGGSPSGNVDYTIAVATPATGADLVLDAAGWLVDLGGKIDDQPGPLNPIGPLAAAALGAAETFKALFGLSYPDAPATRRFDAASGRFSFFDYAHDGQSPALTPVEIDAFLAGAGGVAAGTITALGELGRQISGSLRLIDHDLLDSHSLNRVSYARWASAVNQASKVAEAKFYLDARLPNLTVTAHPESFSDFKHHLAPRRSERRYDLIVTALDNDDVRHEVQRELPRVLVDAATGRDANCRVERVLLGEWACLGCTRRPPPPPTDGGEGDGECGSFPDEHAPSVSFLSALPGILAAGELLKQAQGGAGSLRGAFEHVFTYGPNADLTHEMAPSAGCAVGCGKPSVLGAYRTKYQNPEAISATRV
jgi:hypothetical protein